MFAAELWFRSLPEVPPEEVPAIEKFIFDALGRMREYHQEQPPTNE